MSFTLCHKQDGNTEMKTIHEQQRARMHADMGTPCTTQVSSVISFWPLLLLSNSMQIILILMPLISYYQYAYINTADLHAITQLTANQLKDVSFLIDTEVVCDDIF